MNMKTTDVTPVAPMMVLTYATEVQAAGQTPGEAVEKLAQTILLYGLEQDGKFDVEVSLVQSSLARVWRASVWIRQDLEVER